jgi:uncharacterized iron-regulated membrane protein
MPLAAVTSAPSGCMIRATPAGRLRRVLLSIHRYVGLAIALFLLIAGTTGSALVFYHELDEALSPQLHRVAPPAIGASLLDPYRLRERLAAELPGATVDTLILDAAPDSSATLWLTGPDGTIREYFIDPYTGRVLGSRAWGDLAEGWVNLMPFIYRLHYQLALGDVGTLLLGIVALLWTVDCFVGLFLTLPPPQTRRSAIDERSWLARWRPAWIVRTGSLFGAIFTGHRAAGLWLWALLLVFAWSAVGFNARPVFTPVMSAVLPMTDAWTGLPGLDQPRNNPHLDWQHALSVARRLMATEAERRRFTITAEGSLSYAASQGLYRYDVYSSLDLGDRWPATRIWFDGDSGALHAFDAPTGVAPGNTATAWLFALHMGTIGGLAYRLLVLVVGLAAAALSVTGVLIWWHKRRRNRQHPLEQPVPSQPPPARTIPNAPT